MARGPHQCGSLQNAIKSRKVNYHGAEAYIRFGSLANILRRKIKSALPHKVDMSACTSSALVSSAGGTVRPSAFKVGQRHSPSPDTGQKSASPISIGRRAIEVEVANHVVAVAPVELLISFK